MTHSSLRAGPGAILAVVVAMTVPGPARPAAAAGPRIASIEIRGNSRTPASDVLSILGMKEGDEWSARAVTEGTRRLQKRGIFADAAVSASEAADGVHVYVDVAEKPPVKGVTIDGTRDVKKDDLQEVLTLGAGSLWDEAVAHEDREAILSKLTEKGFHRGTVRAAVDTLGDGSVFVHWKVDEGEKTRVRAVEFEGNSRVSSDDLREGLETRPRRWFSGGDFKQEAFDADLERITGSYQSRGYLDAKVTGHQLRYDAEGGLTVVVGVDEGRQYHAGEFRFEGNRTVGTAELDSRLALRPGQVFDESRFQAGMEGLYDAYGERGYVYANIAPERTVSGDTVSVVFRIDEGDPARVGSIEITGNHNTREKVVRRELKLVPGDLFRRSALVRSHRDVYQLGFFEDVQVKTNVSPNSPDIDLVFDVKEKETGQFLAGASYSGEFGLVGNLEMAKTNWRGSGQTISLKGDFGRIGQLEFSFTEPYLSGSRTSLGVDLFNTRLERDTYTEKSRGAAIRVGRPLPWLDYTRVSMRYKWEQWEVTGERSSVPLGFGMDPLLDRQLRFSGEGNASSVQTVFQRNSTDSPFFPTRGSLTRLTSEFSGGPLGGDTGFQSHILDQQFFVPVGKKMAFSVGMRAGGISRYRHGTVPVFEKFRLGGIGSNGIRGYPDLDVVPEGNDSGDGGRAMLLLRAEQKFPITGPQLFGLLFLDAGNVWNSMSEVQPGALKRGAGLGFRVEVPGLGTLGFDYGYGFDRTEDQGGPGWELHFNIGSASQF